METKDFPSDSKLLILHHRVDRVLSFLSSRRNRDPPLPRPQVSVSPPGSGGGGGADSLAVDGMRGVGPNSDDGTDNVVL